MRQVPRLNDNCTRFKNINHDIGSSSKNLIFSWEYFSEPQFRTLMMGCVRHIYRPPMWDITRSLYKAVKGHTNNYKCISCTTLKFKTWSHKNIFCNAFHCKGKHAGFRDIPYLIVRYYIRCGSLSMSNVIP